MRLEKLIVKGDRNSRINLNTLQPFSNLKVLLKFCFRLLKEQNAVVGPHGTAKETTKTVRDWPVWVSTTGWRLETHSSSTKRSTSKPGSRPTTIHGTKLTTSVSTADGDRHCQTPEYFVVQTWAQTTICWWARSGSSWKGVLRRKQPVHCLWQSWKTYKHHADTSWSSETVSQYFRRTCP